MSVKFSYATSSRFWYLPTVCKIGYQPQHFTFMPFSGFYYCNHLYRLTHSLETNCKESISALAKYKYTSYHVTKDASIAKSLVAEQQLRLYNTRYWFDQHFFLSFFFYLGFIRLVGDKWIFVSFLLVFFFVYSQRMLIPIIFFKNISHLEFRQNLNM